MFQGIDVHQVRSSVTTHEHPRATLQVVPARKHRLLVHPEHEHPELIRGRAARRAASTSPRLMSISSSRTRVTAWPATAASRSPSKVTTRATLNVARSRAARERRRRAYPAGGNGTAEAAEIQVWPVHPLHGHAERRGSRSLRPARFPDARVASALCTSVLSRLVVTLSPFSADIGIARRPRAPSCAANCRYSATMSSNTFLS